MTCQELTEFLIDYLDGEVSEAERVCFEEHIAECPDCVAYLATYRQAVQLGKNVCAEEDALAPEVPADLVRAVLVARGQRGN